MMKKKMFLCAMAGVAVSLLAVTTVHARGGPPADVGVMILERLISALELAAAGAPSWLGEFFEGIIAFLQAMLGG